MRESEFVPQDNDSLKPAPRLGLDGIDHPTVDPKEALELLGWVDQKSSPLGPRRHIKAIRTGKLRGVVLGRRYLAKLDDVERYLWSLCRRPSQPAPQPNGEERLAGELGLQRKPGSS